MNLPAVIHFPFYDEENGEQRFPFRTFLMLASIVIQLVVSIIAKRIFEGGHLSLSYDLFECFDDSNKRPTVVLEINGHHSSKPIDEEALFLDDSQSIPSRQRDLMS